VSLKSRLQRIKRRVEERTTAEASSSSSSITATPPPPSITATPPPPSSETLRLSRAKELAARAQKRKEDEEKKSEAPAQTSAELPAHQRYHSLAQAAPPGLVLPFSYRVLAEMFRSMDTVVAMLYNRCETATFSKVQRGVQDMMHKRFEESHVGQIRCVFPEAYTFRQQKDVPPFHGGVKPGGYQLTVEPVRPVLSASRLLDRRRVFHLNLLSIVKQHHKAFLSSLTPPLSVPEDKLTRWHPRFSVDTVPAPQSAALPRAPHAQRPATAREVLDQARHLLTPKMEKALVSAALREDRAAEGEEKTPPRTAAAPPAAPPAAALRGVSQSLLDRIRAKEAQKLQAALTRDPAQDQRLLMMSRLGELARILRGVFVAEKKPALTMEVVCNRLESSYRSALTAGEMEKHVRLLAELAADWLSIHPIRKDFYLKLNKGMELSAVLDRLSRRLQEEERGGGP
uniref:Chromatin licensing and DNA replication factor 1 n=1 Tax=Salarias fasciatus TaxID=181472 RepID=A0A672H192_SALFA